MKTQLLSFLTVGLLFANVGHAQSSLQRCDASAAKASLKAGIIEEIKKDIPQADLNTLDIKIDNHAGFRSLERFTSYSDGHSYRYALVGVYRLHIQVKLTSGDVLTLYSRYRRKNEDMYSDGLLKTALYVINYNGRPIESVCNASINLRHAEWSVRQIKPPYGYQYYKRASFSEYIEVPNISNSLNYDPNQQKAKGECDYPDSTCYFGLEPGEAFAP